MKKCRICNERLQHIVTDLGMSPLANSYLNQSQLNKAELFLPLKVYVCQNCFLVQLEEYETPKNIFTDYAYFSSVSTSWILHVQRYCEKMIELLHLSGNSRVIEIASNDGYLLKNFLDKQIPVLGIEPAKNVAKVAQEKGIETYVDFFTEKLAAQLFQEGLNADLLVANNVLAHVPNIVDFVRGLKKLLANSGTITLEFPHLLNLLEQIQYDTIYHEHFSYLSLLTVKQLFEREGLIIYDVEELITHGGSLRIYAKHVENTEILIEDSVKHVLMKEYHYGLDKIDTYLTFSKKVKVNKRELLNLLIDIKNSDYSTIVGYGAPAKGNTLLNYCGIKNDFIEFTVDKSEHKQGLYLPGTHLPVKKIEDIIALKPNYILILPWNLKDEIIAELNKVNSWGAKYIVSIPNVEVIE